MTRFTFLAVTLAIGSVIVATQSTRAQSPPSIAPVAHPQAPGMAMSDAQMMGMHEKMMSDMKTMDVKLDALMTTMNAAKGTAKVDAMAEAMVAMVSQHKAMRNGMMEMHGHMMKMHGPMTMPMGSAK